MRFGLYLHVPFCEQHCHYCTFPVAVRPRTDYAAYVRRLKTEMKLAGLQARPRTVYLGGGTPSLLPADSIAALLDAWVDADAEVSIEVNPGTLADGAARRYRAMGINRVSLGAQSFEADELRSAGRLHAPADTVRDFDTLRAAGFANISLDLIAGLPKTDRGAWERNLDWVGRLSPDHVSIYLLELEDSAVWSRQGVGLHSGADHAWLYRTAMDRLGDAGYVHYETSSWARPGSECLHNLGYWTGAPYRGVGLGAHSFMDGRRFWNTRSLAEYRTRIDSGELPIAGAETRTPRVRIEEAFLLGLRRRAGFDTARVAEDLGIAYPRDWFDRVERLADAGFVSFDGRILKLAPEGLFVSDSVVEELLCPSLLSICEATP